jgi:cAMP-dependent protein kinase regulator
MYNWPRASTVTSTKEGILWALDRSTFKHVIVDANRKKAKMYEEFLAKHEIMAKLDAKERAIIADNFLPLEFAAGKDVVVQGDADKSTMKFYIVIEGELKAVRDGVEVNKHVAGAYFGEKALIEDVPRAATIQTITPCKLVAMDVAAFIRLMGPCQEVMKRNIAEYKTAEQASAESK